MADSFKKRQKGEERRYELQQELLFKAESRRNRLLGEWLAERFGLAGDEVSAYAKEVVVADLDEPGIEDVIRKVMADVSERGAPITEEDVRKKMEELFSVAVEQVQNET